MTQVIAAPFMLWVPDKPDDREVRERRKDYGYVKAGGEWWLVTSFGLIHCLTPESRLNGVFHVVGVESKNDFHRG